MAIALKLLGCMFALALLVRLSFTLLFTLTSVICLQDDVTTETCGNETFTQNDRNRLDMAGTFMEAGSSLLIIAILFSWSRFSVKTFCRAIPWLPVFWLWVALFVVANVSIVSLDFKRDNIVLGISLLLELGSLVILCCAFKFVYKSTVKRAFERQHRGWVAKFLYNLFMATMWAYMFRNLTLFLYDTSVFAKKINRHAFFTKLDALLLLANCATRGSFLQFFYAYIFANPVLPIVCDNAESARTRDEYGRVGVRDTMGGFQPVLEWVTEFDENNRLF